MGKVKQPMVEVYRAPDIWAFDPGAVATGVARLNLRTNEFGLWQFEDPREATECMLHVHHGYDFVLVEDYSHGGTFTKEAKQTLEVVGYLRYSIPNVILRHKDKRLSGQAEAAKMMESTIPELKRSPQRKDAFSALSHCITFRRDYV